MKKIFIMLLLMLSSVSASYAASEDMSVYVRQDVFDAKMEALFNGLHGEIKVLSERMDGNYAALSEHMDGNYAALSERMDKNFAEFKALATEIRGEVRTLDARVSSIESNVSWWIGGVTLLLTAIALLPLLLKILENLRKPSFTLDDVRNLIVEAKLSGTPQV